MPEMMDAASLRFSDAGVDLLKVLEGVRLQPYDDATGRPLRDGEAPRGIATIGIGHVIKAGETFPRDFSDAHAVWLLHKDLQRFVTAVQRSVHVGITQAMFDALVIFTFNIGVRAFRGSTIPPRRACTALRRLNARDYPGCAEAMAWFNKQRLGLRQVVVPGLVRRRQAEISLFLRGTGMRLDARSGKVVAG